ncbi:MAG: hypothetical protein HON68_05210 [Gammaproteobacteria bacterium]|jgi:hypothetical protein|nr:hypothetical protein [Gammaproteobacteria bacterium]MBT3489391.1 hypothetical protein [Gammaproteobacteria bacterium]MBT3718320.1 hypothetical protein [Gammaproteobacteria bacterium]MBT3844053.1 hypothetical protein [Gammaproteobacteria bacterium]MBT3892197.1 hypothetical protein [Gammaproteobacteria bacterium]
MRKRVASPRKERKPVCLLLLSVPRSLPVPRVDPVPEWMMWFSYGQDWSG